MIPSTEEIELMTGPQLIKTYNEIAPGVGQNPTKKFADRATGIKRLIAVADVARTRATPDPVVTFPLIVRPDTVVLRPGEVLDGRIANTSDAPVVVKKNGHKVAVVDKPKRVTFAGRCRELFAEGKTDKEALAVIIAEDIPGNKNLGHVNWHRNNFRRKEAS